MTKMALKQFAQDLTSNLALMKDREKAETKRLLGGTVTIREFGFLQGDDGDYVAFTVDEDDKNFYFGGSILTEHMHEIEANGYRQEVEENGLPVLMTEKTSKKNRTYTNIEFYPED